MNITAGIYKGRKIKTPDEKITRPTLSKVRMGVFNTLKSILGNFSENSFLDVFGGSGIIGLEALSRGFSKVTVYEKNRIAAGIITQNYRNLGLEPDLKIGDSLILLKKSPHFDVAYVDPPYQSGIYDKILPLIKADIIIVEHDKPMDFDNFDIIKQKNYGGKIITFCKKKTL